MCVGGVWIRIALEVEISCSAVGALVECRCVSELAAYESTCLLCGLGAP